jgi:hypothetical protein
MKPDLHTTIRARAPLRLGLGGGGTDLSPYCDEFGGAVLNTTIDRFAYAFISPRDDGLVVFRAKDLGREEMLEAAPRLPEARLLLHRGVYERMVREYNDGRALAATITTTVDAPLGSGLGSSSALVVALVDAFCALFGAPLGQYDVAHLAFIDRAPRSRIGRREAGPVRRGFRRHEFYRISRQGSSDRKPIASLRQREKRVRIFACRLLFRTLARRNGNHRATDRGHN